jgi:hypothetical protein
VGCCNQQGGGSGGGEWWVGGGETACRGGMSMLRQGPGGYTLLDRCTEGVVGVGVTACMVW